MEQHNASPAFAAEHPRFVYGCMRLVGDGSSSDRARGKRALRAAVDAGFTHFDHADIYAGGECETLFGEALRESPGLRESLTIIGKCGIRFEGDPGAGYPKRYDFSASHIEASVNGSLQRLGIERLDALLLHRPDYLMEPDEVAVVFERLHTAGKVHHFGTSNFSPTQFALLKQACPMPLVANQVEINLENPAALEDGTLDQCQELGVVPQAWSPLRGAIEGSGDPERWQRVAPELAAQATGYGTEPWLVALAWLLRHPARIAVIVGSQSPDRIAAAQRAASLAYSREDWYRLLEARNGYPAA